MKLFSFLQNLKQEAILIKFNPLCSTMTPMSKTGICVHGLAGGGNGDLSPNWGLRSRLCSGRPGIALKIERIPRTLYREIIEIQTFG